MIAKIVETIFYVTGYGAFMILSLDVRPEHEKAYYATIVPFLMIVAIMIIAHMYVIWR